MEYLILLSGTCVKNFTKRVLIAAFPTKYDMIPHLRWKSGSYDPINNKRNAKINLAQTKFGKVFEGAYFLFLKFHFFNYKIEAYFSMLSDAIAQSTSLGEKPNLSQLEVIVNKALKARRMQYFRDNKEALEAKKTQKKQQVDGGISYNESAEDNVNSQQLYHNSEDSTDSKSVTSHVSETASEKDLFDL